MNRKIFTLLVGAIILACSAFTVNAQVHPYSPKTGQGQVNFNDMLTADPVISLPSKATLNNYSYLLSVTGIENTGTSSAAIQALRNTITSAGTPIEQGSLVMYIDSIGTTATRSTNLRLDYLARLDDSYNFTLEASHKFGALRRALWCVTYDLNSVPGSNIGFNFNQVITGEPLLAPVIYGNYSKWSRANDKNWIYNGTINTRDSSLIVNGWHFSQTYLPTQNLQRSMPLFSYVNKDTVAVFVLEDNVTYENSTGTGHLSGGYRVSVKHVAVDDLLADAAGNVYTGGGSRPRTPVQNVLLFTLKQVNSFVLNANDWNAINNKLSITPNNATIQVSNSKPSSSTTYTNPFTDSGSTPLRAVEVQDSLYHYGYMQFYRGTESNPDVSRYLHVDTAWVNDGNNIHLAFEWSKRRDNSSLAHTNSIKWGDSYGNKPDMMDYLINNGDTVNVYWRLDSLLWATLKRAYESGTVNPIPMSGLLGTGPEGAIYNSTGLTVDIDFDADEALNWNEIIDEAAALGLDVSTFPNTLTAATYTLCTANGYPGEDAGDQLGTWVYAPPTSVLYQLRPGFELTTQLDHASYSAEIELFNQFAIDSVSYIFAYMKDSIMENQSKFRVVYNPTADSTFINVYQTRVRYPDYTNGSHNYTWPAWWENSFGIGTDVGTYSENIFIRPSDFFTGVMYGDIDFWNYFYGIPPPIPVNPIAGAAKYYYDLYIALGALSNSSYYTTNGEHRISNYTGITVTNPYSIHGPTGTMPKELFNFHSFMNYYSQSTLSNIDKVLISTADTVPLYNNFYATGDNYKALSHMYGWSVTNNNELRYRDSLFYIDFQNLQGSTNSIITLNQSFQNNAKGLNRKIGLNLGRRCAPVDAPVDNTLADLGSDLFLIRNELGQYLCVPLWSITDSIYWVYPEANEDLTKLPNYQWAVINLYNGGRSPYRIVNREFKKVELPFVSIREGRNTRFVLAGSYINASFNNKSFIGAATPTGTTGNLRPLELTDAANRRFAAATFASDVEKIFPLSTYGFIRLGNTVKQNQLLGYKYIDKDSTYIDVYALKYLHFLGKQKPRYLSWKGYETSETTLYAQGTDYYDKLYFMLQEMDSLDINPYDNNYHGRLGLTRANITSGYRSQYAPLFNSFANKTNNYTNRDVMVMEAFGYWEPLATTHIANLRPLARQAYRLFLQDYYRWHPTLKGHYVTVGEQDRYVLTDKADASKKYVKGSGSIAGLFGLPYFYFRETFFDVDKLGDDYFAIVQRLDTMKTDIAQDYFEYYAPSYGDIADYMTYRYGGVAANKILDQIRRNGELGLAFLDVEADFGRAKFIIRGDVSVGQNISTFQLERDEDPIYRRFHKNEPNEKFGGDLWNTDQPDSLEFHLLNDAEAGYKLFENVGNYLDEGTFNGVSWSGAQANRFDSDGGRQYNRRNDGNGDYYRDTLGNVISFLGMNNSVEYPDTKRSFYVDTAYINRGTGWIKPQYLIAVDPYNPIEEGDCDPNNGDYDSPNKKYVIARYMFNTAQYSKEVKDSVLYRNPSTGAQEWHYTGRNYTIASQNNTLRFNKNNFSKVEPIKDEVVRKINGEAYTYNEKWERIAFAWAIHFNDKLYVLKGVEPGYQGNTVGDPKRLFDRLVAEYGGGSGKSRYIDFNKLVSENSDGTFREAYYPLGERSGEGESRTFYNFKKYAPAGKTIGLHAIIDLADNTHKDWVWSFRYVERGSSNFVIESETSERDIRNAAIIRPGYGGWVKWQNGVPVITRSDEKDNMGQAGGSIFDVTQSVNPVSNETIGAESSVVNVIGGTGAVTILNAADKKVVISNLLGQTIANVVVTSNNATIAAPAGFVIVAIEGEETAKVLVK